MISSSSKIRDNLFREHVSTEVVSDILKMLKFDGINDNRLFSTKNIDVSLFDMAVIILEPYYIPCKAKKYLYGNMTAHRVLTILRQILKPVGYNIHGQEKTMGRKKEMVYQIIQTEFEKEIPANSKIEFN
jgi:hypothetical protein